MFHNFHEKNVNLHVYQLQPFYIQSQKQLYFIYLVKHFHANNRCTFCVSKMETLVFSVKSYLYDVYLY